jgi:hypothetical protein
MALVAGDFAVRRSTVLIERYVMLRKPATMSSGTSTGQRPSP